MRMRTGGLFGGVRFAMRVEHVDIGGNAGAVAHFGEARALGAGWVPPPLAGQHRETTVFRHLAGISVV